jgi:effector-binding domain-containing protein
MIDFDGAFRAGTKARCLKERSMVGPWRAMIVAGVLAFGAVPVTYAQPSDPPPGASEASPPPSEPQSPAPAKNDDPFGEELVLSPKTIVFLRGQSTWDKALESLIDAFRSVYTFLDKQGLKRAGPAMTVYTEADDTGFKFQAAVPIEQEPPEPPKGDMAVGRSPGGKALKFVHRGSYDSMDATYEAITYHLDEKRLEAQDVFVEEYQTDPVTTDEEKFVVFIYVPIK